MKSKLIAIRSTGEGFRDAHLETEEMGATLPEEQKLHLCLITEEMLSLFNSVTGTVDNAEFWLEEENGLFTFHLSATQKLGNIQRDELIQSTTSGTNEASKGFLGKLKEMFIQAMSVGKDIDLYYSSEGYSQAADLTDAVISSPKWDKFERSVLLSLTDEVRISIKGGKVDLIAIKQF
ncbi:MAG: hypothetical protein Q4D81_12080 [Eubacteriales bacterium]|jgi:hypothetical protein|nr:hypothetical protein [Eubacteriales bacterium]